MAMSTSSSLLEMPKPEEDVNYDKICEEYNLLKETLPKGNGWLVQENYNYKGFWLIPFCIKANLLLHAYFKPQPTDIYLASFMKSGTTWLKSLVFSTINRHRYSFSDHYLHHNNPQTAFPVLEAVCETYPIKDYIDMSSPRIFATHYPLTLLPSSVTSCKIVYICRDPKDVLISKWIFIRKLRDKDLPPLEFDEAFDLFCRGVSDYGPIWEHVLSYWRASLASPEKIMFLKYEEVKKNPKVVVEKLASFMGVPFSEEEVEKGVVGDIVSMCSFGNLSNLDVNKKGVYNVGELVVEKHDLFRKGEVGDWKNYLTNEMQQRIDGIIHEKLKGSGLFFGVEP